MCKICNSKFDRDKEPYVLYGNKKYAHAKCYLADKVNNPEAQELEIIDPTDMVKCSLCGKLFSKKETEYEMIGENKYYHKECAIIESKREKTDQEKLDLYICQLFSADFVPPRIKKQINEFTTKYNYTHRGIAFALRYFFEVKKNDISKCNETIGIVPYVYKEAMAYYQALAINAQLNNNKDVKTYIPKVIEIKIEDPQIKIKKKNKFSFLDNDEVSND